MRPRDFIAFIRSAAKISYERNSNKGIAVRDLVEADRLYSEYLVQEIRDGICGVHRDLQEALFSVRDIGKRVFNFSVLESAVSKRMTDDMKESMSSRFIIDLLFYFNVIGRHFDNYRGNFHFHGIGDKVNDSWEFVVHRGLWRDFGLVSGDLRTLKETIKNRS